MCCSEAKKVKADANQDFVVKKINNRQSKFMKEIKKVVVIKWTAMDVVVI